MDYPVKLKGFADAKRPYIRPTLEKFIKVASSQKYQHSNLLLPFIELMKTEKKNILFRQVVLLIPRYDIEPFVNEILKKYSLSYNDIMFFMEKKLCPMILDIYLSKGLILTEEQINKIISYQEDVKLDYHYEYDKIKRDHKKMMELAEKFGYLLE